MRFKLILKKAGKKIYYSLKRKKISGKIYCAYKEKKCSFFDPYFYKDKLLISDRNNKCIREFIIRDDFTLIKTNNIFRKKDINEFENVNRGSIFEVNKKEYLVFTYQFNGRSIIVKKDLENNFLINEKDVLIDTTLYYEKMSVMNPYIIQHGKELYCLYSAGETYEPDSICMAKILDFDNNIIIKYQFNPIFANNNKYFYRYQKVAFGDLVFYKGYYLLFYIGYYTIDKAYINVASCKYEDFPNFKDINNINPLISPGAGLESVYKPCVLIKDRNLVIYFNGRKRTHESIYYVKISLDNFIRETKLHC